MASSKQPDTIKYKNKAATLLMQQLILKYKTTMSDQFMNFELKNTANPKNRITAIVVAIIR